MENIFFTYHQWKELYNAPHSAFFKGLSSDTAFDRARQAILSPSTDAMFTQSNARVLCGQSANGNLRMVAIPTQLYPAPTGLNEFGLGPGMYHRFDVVMYAGDLNYKIALEGSDRLIELADLARDNQTVYADHFLPLTTTQEENLEIHLFSLAPVAADTRHSALAPAPLPGPAGVIYALVLKNTSPESMEGKIILEAGDLLVGHYEDAAPEVRATNKPQWSIRQGTLILTRPFGTVGIHLHNGKWTHTETPYQSELAFQLQAGEEALFETFVAIGASYHEIMPVIYEMHLHPVLDWLNKTAAYWRSRLGHINVRAEGADEEAQIIQEVYIRNLFDNFNCLQTDASGNLLAHWQGAPSHGYGICWGIDVEPTAVSVVHLCPEITRQTMLFFLDRSRAPIGSKDHSVPILVAPLILARQWLQVSGDVDFLRNHPQVMESLSGILDELIGLKANEETLFPSRYSSDGPVGRRYDYGTNVKVFYAFESMAYLMERLGRIEEARRYIDIGRDILASIERKMIVAGPFGPQISGGTNLGEEPSGFYLPESSLYYDGEDTSSMLAPVYGACNFDWQPWINYHRFARSMWCPNFDPEFGVLNWFPKEGAVLDGTAFFSRLGGSTTKNEMKEAVRSLRISGIDDATGSVFWWPHGLEYKRSLTRCSQGQGAWAWQYLQQWLGITVDRDATTLIVAPAGLLTAYDWKGFCSGQSQFDIDWEETPKSSRMRVHNLNASTWTIKVGFRWPGSGATSQMNWQSLTAAPGQEVEFEYIQPTCVDLPQDMTEEAIMRREAQVIGQGEQVLFRRYGPGMLWGNWDARNLWDNSALPNSLRFLVTNLTNEDWMDVKVYLTCPDGWLAQGRQPRHWPHPDRMESGEVCLVLGEIHKMTRMVAPFWVQAPGGKGLSYHPTAPVSPHFPTQLTAGLCLSSSEITQTNQVTFTAQLLAVSSGGKEISSCLDIPVTIEPIRKTI